MAVPSNRVHGEVAVVPAKPVDTRTQRTPTGPKFRRDVRLDACRAVLDEYARRMDSLEELVEDREAKAPPVVRSDAVVAAASTAPRCDTCGARTDAADDRYPVKLELELTQLTDLKRFLEFLKFVKRTAAIGHSFEIAADTDAEPGRDGAETRMFGKQRCGATAYIDGDGPDRIGRIWVNGEELR